MKLVSDKAIILDVKESSFKGRDGNEVTFKQARIIDDNNDLQKVTVPSDFDFGDLVWSDIFRVECNRVIIEVTENDNKLRKRLVSIA